MTLHLEVYKINKNNKIRISFSIVVSCPVMRNYRIQKKIRILQEQWEPKRVVVSTVLTAVIP